MNEITKKQRWVLVPCPDYDVPAMESWLEEQAMQGLFLCNLPPLWESIL